MSSFDKSLIQRLQALDEANLLRQRKVLNSPQQPTPVIDGRSFIAFCSNDYLGMANHPEVKQAAINAIERFGVGSGASHLVVGHHQEHQFLEEELAEFTGRDRALVFSTGYMANLALISALVGKNDLVLEDKLNHASLIDGGLLSGARFQRYLHNDMSSLEAVFQRFSRNGKTADAIKLVVTDGVFSMDGDKANLPELSALCSQYDGVLMVDDAHGFGVVGPQGRGCVAESGLSQNEVPILIGTFGKACGTAGAFVAGSDDLIELLLQTARPYIYTTAMPSSLAAATRKSLALIRKADDEREHLASLIAYFRDQASIIGFDLQESQTPIQVLVIGDNKKTVDLAQFLESNGILAAVIRPPTVPKNTARLRLTFSSDHTFRHIDALLASLNQARSQGLV